MYQWLLGALGALLAAARRPAPPPAPPPRRRPRPSVWPLGEDRDEAQLKKQKTDDDVSEERKEVPKVSLVVTLPAQVTRKRRAAPLTEPAEETQSTTCGPASKRQRSAAVDKEMLQVGNMPCGTTTCLTKGTLPLSYETVPLLRTSKNGKHQTAPSPGSIWAPTPSISERPVPESMASELGKMGRPLCAAEEGVQRGEKWKYTQLLQMAKEKHPRSLFHPQLTRLRKIPASSKEPPMTKIHLEEEKHADVYPHMTLKTSTRGADVGSPQLPQRSNIIRHYTPAENSYEQGKPVKETIKTRQYGDEPPEETLLQLQLEPGLDAKENKFTSLEEPTEDFSPLKEAMQREIAAVFDEGEPDDIMSSAFKLKVTREDIHTLRDLQWLNDEIINFYIALLVERNKKKGFPAAHAFSTFFYPKLISGGYAAVKRWTRSVSLFEQDLVFVPIHLRVHWALAVIDMREKKITYYDSMGKNGKSICEILFQYLEEESLQKRNVKLALEDWTLYSMKPHEIPQQLNGSDCGVFICQYADYISRNKAITFTQTHMPYFRKKMVWEIIHQELL